MQPKTLFFVLSLISASLLNSASAATAVAQPQSIDMVLGNLLPLIKGLTGTLREIQAGPTPESEARILENLASATKTINQSIADIQTSPEFNVVEEPVKAGPSNTESVASASTKVSAASTNMPVAAPAPAMVNPVVPVTEAPKSAGGSAKKIKAVSKPPSVEASTVASVATGKLQKQLSGKKHLREELVVDSSIKSARTESFIAAEPVPIAVSASPSASNVLDVDVDAVRQKLFNFISDKKSSNSFDSALSAVKAVQPVAASSSPANKIAKPAVSSPAPVSNPAPQQQLAAQLAASALVQLSIPAPISATAVPAVAAPVTVAPKVSTSVVAVAPVFAAPVSSVPTTIDPVLSELVECIGDADTFVEAYFNSNVASLTDALVNDTDTIIEFAFKSGNMDVFNFLFGASCYSSAVDRKKNLFNLVLNSMNAEAMNSLLDSPDFQSFVSYTALGKWNSNEVIRKKMMNLMKNAKK